MEDEKQFQRDLSNKELSRRFAAAYTSYCAGVALPTGYKYLGNEAFGDLWYCLVDVAMEQATAGTKRTVQTTEAWARMVQ